MPFTRVALLFVCSLAVVRCHISPNVAKKAQDEESESSEPVSDHRFFLQQIFTKYGHNGQMTFEGFEHLLESLGLGNILITDHDVGAHQERLFLDTHATHHHPRDPAHEDSLSLTRSPAMSNASSELAHPKQLNRTFATAQPDFRTTTAVEADDRSTATTPDGVVHYSFKIPELLVNISTLVDQHQEIRSSAPEIVIDQCLSPREILDAFGINQSSSVSPVGFLHLCPAIIYELDQGHCVLRPFYSRPGPLPVLHQWLYAGVSVGVISVCGLLSVAVVPLVTRWFYQTLMQFLVGLAVGSLTGDALLHLLPHAMLGDVASHDEARAVWKGLVALSSVLFFFVAERLLASYSEHRRRRPPTSTAGGYDCGGGREVIDMLNHEGYISRKNSMDSLSGMETNFKVPPAVSVPPATYSNGALAGPGGHGHGHSHEVPSSVSAVAWMVIMGDGLHNFCDGLAIGAAFASGVEGGISTAVAVFCHELPHELGDFAMLLKSGMKVRQALLYNVLSSVLCLTGMAIGVSLGNVHSATEWIFAATAGMFLYIALVDMLPELTTGPGDSISATVYQLAVQVLGISCGITIMLLIATYEQELKSIVS